MEELLYFVAIEFVDDPNVVGNVYWYHCDDKTAAVGDRIVAPLGRHNREQIGIIRTVLFATREKSPFPFIYIKKSGNVIREQKIESD